VSGPVAQVVRAHA